MVVLSVLDQSPVRSGSTPADALRETVALAQAADRLGYHRYWLAEHHNTAGLAGSAPEVLTARVAASTASIRVGSGGVMLTHYSSLKVAEAFRVLHTLFPGRIDLGIGRAEGADAVATAALQPGPDSFGPEHFPRRVAEVVGFLTGSLDPDHPYAGVRAVPEGEGGPEVWLLGSSSEGAGNAAALGLPFCFAHFINPAYGAQVVALYRRTFQPSPVLEQPRANVAVSVVCADTDAEAERLATSYRVWRLTSHDERGPVPSPEEAEAKVLSGVHRARLAQERTRVIVGDPERARSQLEALAAAFGVDELVVVTVCHDPEARRRSYELLAEAFGLAPRRH